MTGSVIDYTVHMSTIQEKIMRAAGKDKAVRACSPLHPLCVFRLAAVAQLSSPPVGRRNALEWSLRLALPHLPPKEA